MEMTFVPKVWVHKMNSGITTCDHKRTDRCMHKRRRTTRELANNNRTLKPQKLWTVTPIWLGAALVATGAGGSIELDILAQTDGPVVYPRFSKLSSLVTFFDAPSRLSFWLSSGGFTTL